MSAQVWRTEDRCEHHIPPFKTRRIRYVIGARRQKGVAACALTIDAGLSMRLNDP